MKRLLLLSYVIVLSTLPLMNGCAAVHAAEPQSMPRQSTPIIFQGYIGQTPGTIAQNSPVSIAYLPSVGAVTFTKISIVVQHSGVCEIAVKLHDFGTDQVSNRVVLTPGDLAATAAINPPFHSLGEVEMQIQDEPNCGPRPTGINITAVGAVQ